MSWPEHSDILGRLTGSDRPIDLPNQLTSDFVGLPENLNIYADITRALTANLFRAIRIRLLQALNSSSGHLVLRDASRSYLHELSIRFNHVMQKTAEMIYRDVPLAISNCNRYELNNPELPGQRGKDTLSRGHVSNIGAYCSKHSCRKYRIHGRALRAWLMLFPLESALTVDSIPESLRERLKGSLNYTRNIMGLDVDA